MFAPHELVSRVSLVRSPEAQVPPPVTRPADIHPLPDSIDAYIVYPFSAEEYVLAGPSSAQVKALFERHNAYLASRRDARQQREHMRLARLAPGWGGGSTVLEPTMLHQQQGAVDAPPPRADADLVQDSLRY